MKDIYGWDMHEPSQSLLSRAMVVNIVMPDLPSPEPLHVQLNICLTL
jgi:hypothetical protein